MENHLLLPLAASICLFTAMIQAWLMTLIRYLKIESIRNLFPNYRDLVRSHVDYLMMASLIFAIYLVVVQLEIVLPAMVVWLLFVGSIYNPFGFLLQAIKPNIVEGGGVLAKAGAVLGFIPLTLGIVCSSALIVKACLGS